MKLHPNWISGFVDGEGTFYIGINRQPSMTAGYQILPEFRVVQHKRDIKLLYALKDFFGCGVVRKNHDDRYELRIRSLADLSQKVIPHFERYNLHTQKKFDFLKFKKIIRFMQEGKHLGPRGLLQIIEISQQMNRKDKQSAHSVKKELFSRIRKSPPVIEK